MLDAQPDARRSFQFNGDLGKFKLDDIEPQDGDAFGNSATFTVSSNSYTISERLPQRWYLANIKCDPTENVITDLMTASVTITVNAGDAITCGFTNQCYGKIRSRVFNDENGDGKRRRERVLPDIEVQVYDASGTLVDT